MNDEPGQPGPEERVRDDGEDPALRDAARNLESGAARTSTLPEQLRHLPERAQAQQLDLEKNFADQEHDLRERYANSILAILALQLLLADLVFVAFAWAGENWHLSGGVIEVWLGATVVQVIGIVLVVTRHLFPGRGGRVVSA